MSEHFKNKKIVVGVSGGIAAFKAVELVRYLVNAGATVHVVFSRNAKEFVTPLTFATLTGNPVYYKVFGHSGSAQMEHIQCSESADLLVVVPATAATIGKMANGLADDALSNIFIAFRGPVLIAPAMNDGMFANVAVQENITKLQARGVEIIDPETGKMVCGTTGKGRLAELETLLQAIESRLAKSQDLSGLKFLVTAGPTQEPLDPVRFITNPSSGKMGYAIAEKARLRGAEVTLISGPTHLASPLGVTFVPCVQAKDMHSRVMENFPACDVLVMTAAVGDFAPEKVQKEKIKKSGDTPLILKLSPTPDILLEVGQIKSHQLLVGFAAESENVLESARDKLKRKNLDMIVANDISAPGIGFQSDSNQVTFLDRQGNQESLPRMEKKAIADILLDRIKQQIKKSL